MAQTKKSVAQSPIPKHQGVLQRKCACGQHTMGESECTQCGKDKVALQRKPATHNEPMEVPPIVHEVLRSSGQPLEAQTRQLMESRFGEDFSKVRVHTDAQAASSARAVDALAYTVGRDVVFGHGQFASGTSAGQGLLAHELTHVVQQTSASHTVQPNLGIGAENNAAEREADDVAHSLMTGSGNFGLSRFAGPQMQRQAAPGSAGWPGKGINAAKSTVKGIERIPLSGLSVGHQGGKGASGKAIVLLPPTLDATKPVDVLLHFHGHNQGYEQSGKTVRDDAIDNIEGQMSSSSRPQLVGILPQGTLKSSFGETAVPGKKNTTTRSFDADAYVDNVFDVLTNLSLWTAKPTVAGVMITGHSGAGELINEKILGSTLGKNIGANASPTAGSAAPKMFKELALFDAINGPGEHARLSEFLLMKMADELAKVQQLGTESEQVAYLKGSFKFRAYYSHAPKMREFYSQWHVGPVVSPKAVYKVSIQDLITNFLKTAAPALGGASSPVLQAFEANYKVIDAGTVDHDKMVSSGDHLKDAISVLPKRENEFSENDPAVVPRSVYETLRSSGRPLDSGALAWANNHFGHDMSGVRIHDDEHAADSARSIRAQAYTAGRDIVFGKGRYAPSTEAGRRLLAHELTHVIQQGEKPAGSDLEIGPQRDALEAQADRAAHSASAVNLARSFAVGGASVRLQRAPDDPPTVDAAMCEANANAMPAELGTCNYKEPANCPTYEGWISTFTLLKTFDAKDTPGTHSTGNKVLGGVAASKDFRKPSDGKEPGPPPAPGKSFPRLKAGERFIDHPTDEWVKTCLPEKLRATAYQLPADCADVAIILRHVWLAEHNRTQEFVGWTLGSAAGKAEEQNVLSVISSEGTNRVSNLVAPYSDAQGKPLRSIKDLAPLLHAGDILVWWHYDKGFDKSHTGGHTHTIAAVEREQSGALKDLTLLQGNEPLFAGQKGDIQEFLKAENPKKPLPTFKEMGTAPGRRIEEARASTAGLEFIDSDPKTDKSPAPIWKWGTDTLLVAAGPPKSAPRPSMKTVDKKTVRRLSDWNASFKTATTANLFNVFEASLFEARAMIEGGQKVSDDDARGLGEAAGQMVWRLAKKSKDLGTESHSKVIKEMRAMLDAMRGSSNQPISVDKPDTAGTPRFELVRLFGIIDEAFEMAARGAAADIKFDAPGVKPEKVVKTLLTGFDPVNTDALFKPPRAGEWNPSGAAVMAMDGKAIKIEKGAVAAVEGVVLPNSYEEFGAGLVEKMVKPHLGTVDALLTVSLDPQSIKAGGPVRLEQYAVGAHIVEPNTAAKGAGTGKTDFVVEPVAAAPGGGEAKEIIKTDAPLEQIAKETAKPADKSSAGVQQPTIGENVTFMFSSVVEADDALKALGLPAAGSIEVSISDAAALEQISGSMTREDQASPLRIIKGAKKIRLDGPAIKFKAGSKEFHAIVYSGPGGNFLSNEVSYRVLRLLAETKDTKNPISFHTHTEQGNLIPQDTSTRAAVKERADALKKGTGIRDRLIATLTRMIQSVGRIIMGRRKSE